MATTTDKDPNMKGVTSNDGRLLALVLLLAVTLYAMALSSCGFITPKPKLNGVGVSGKLRPLVLNGLEAGDTVSGTIDFSFTPIEDTSEIDSVTVLNNSKYFPEVLRPPFTFSIDTRWWPNGADSLRLGVYLKENENSVDKLFGVPSVIYSVPLTFRNVPFPPGITGQAWTPVSDSAEDISIAWTQPMRLNVKYYVLQLFSEIYDSSAVYQVYVYSPSANEFNDTLKVQASACRIGAGNEFGVSYSPIERLFEQ